MNHDLTNRAETLLAKIKQFEEGAKERLSGLKKQCDGLLQVAAGLSNSWSGSWLGYHSELYYLNFEIPPLENRFDPEWGGIHGIPTGWQALSAEQVRERIESVSSTNFDSLDTDTNDLLAAAKNLQNEILIDLSRLHTSVGFDKERTLLENIEQFRWEKKLGDYIDAHTPAQFRSRDSKAGAQGARIPAYLYYQAAANEFGSRCIAILAFLRLSQRLLRQVQLQASQTPVTKQLGKSDAIQSVKTICERFHQVTRQLRHRHDGRPTLEIKDEYERARPPARTFAPTL